MSLIVEDGSGKADSQVFDTIANCATWLVARGKTSFNALATDALKEQHLLIGTEHVNLSFESKLPGTRLYASLSIRQALTWPRVDARFSDTNGPIDYNEIPSEWKYASFEAAELSAAGTLDTLKPLAGVAEEWSPSGRIKYRPGTHGYPHSEVMRWVSRLLAAPGKFARA